MTIFHVYKPQSYNLDYLINTSFALPGEQIAQRIFQAYLRFNSQITETDVKVKILCSRLLQEDPTSMDLLTPVKNVYSVPLS